MYALLAAMVYVDLNPIRAKMADSLAGSEFTSGLQRLKALRDILAPMSEEESSNVPTLRPLSEQIDSELPLTEQGYLELLDYSGRITKEGKAGFISVCQPAILTYLNMSHDQWRTLCRDFESPFRQFVGS